ncbi:hypothetical protein BDV26DRAFT_270198, partial [Aspergillus bertholletiae]
MDSVHVSIFFAMTLGLGLGLLLDGRFLRRAFITIGHCEEGVTGCDWLQSPGEQGCSA